ncbi:Neprilysin-2 [Nymphon striatum]|nr:Neprilysin-2 [Nymphon striatum]
MAAALISKIVFSEGVLSVDYRETLLDNEKSVHEFRNLLADMAMLYGAKNWTIAYDELGKALDLEIWVANNSLAKEDYRNITAINNKMTLRNLSDLNDKIDWLRVVKHIMPSKFKDNITEDLVIRVYNPKYIALLADKLENTDDRVLKNYFAYKAALPASLQLGRDMKDMYQDFLENVQKRKRLYHYVFCMDDNVSLFTFSLANMFIKKYFSEQTKLEVTGMAERIRDVLTKTISTVDWMDEETRKTALSKIKATKVYIGYPEPMIDDNVINDYYKNVNISHTRHYQNVRNLRRFSNDDHYSVLFYPRKKTEYTPYRHYEVILFFLLDNEDMHCYFQGVELTPKVDWRLHGKSFQANAYYRFAENSIDVYAGIIDGVFYGDGRPRFNTFASLGNVIGHEFTHGFDSVGSKFDQNGNKRNWWHEKTLNKFNKKTQCFVDQYNNYTIQGINMNGELSLPEDIADNGGIKHAYLIMIDFETDFENSENDYLEAIPYQYYEPVLQARIGE